MGVLKFGLIWNVLQVIILFVYGTFGAKIQTYKYSNYSGLLWEVNLTDECSNIPSGKWADHQSVITDTCVILYWSPNCKSSSTAKYMPGKMSHPVWGFTRSLQKCNDQEGGPELNIDITTHFKHVNPPVFPKILESHYDVCRCINIPQYVQEMEKWSIDNHHNELLAYFEPNCAQKHWQALYIGPEHRPNSRDMHTHARTYRGLTVKIQSISHALNSTYYKQSCSKNQVMNLEQFKALNSSNSQRNQNAEPNSLTSGAKIQLYKDKNYTDLLLELEQFEVLNVSNSQLNQNAAPIRLKSGANDSPIHFFGHIDYQDFRLRRAVHKLVALPFLLILIIVMFVKEFLFDKQLTSECSNLPKPTDTDYLPDEILAIETEVCIMVYSDYDCNGRSIKLEPGQGHSLKKEWESTVSGPQTLALLYKMNSNWKWSTKSFSSCNQAQSHLNVDVTEYQGDSLEPVFTVLKRYRDICTCKNVPKYIQVMDKWSINNFGNSMVAYFEHGCISDTLNPLWIPAGRSSFSIGFGLFKQADISTGTVRKIQSFGPDPNAAYFKSNCVKMYSTIIKFEIDEPSYINHEERNVNMLASKTIFRNNGPFQLTQTYSASKIVRESIQIDICTSFSKMDSVQVDNSVDIETRKHKGSSDSKSLGTTTGWSNSQSNSESTNKGFENRHSTSQRTHQSTDSRNTSSVGTSPQTKVEAQAGANRFGITAKTSASVGGQSTGSAHSTSNTQGSNKGSESVKSVSGSSTNAQDVSSGSSRGTITGQKNSANYFQEDGFKQSLRKAFEKSGTLSSSTSNSTTIENSKSFSVTQTITVPPCTEQVVHASVKVVTNKCVEYKALVKIRGQLGNRQMTSTEVRQFMDGELEYIEDFDEYTVLAYSTGIFTAEYGVSSMINSEGSIIKTCQDKLNGCPVCQTCTNEPLLSTVSDSVNPEESNFVNFLI